MKIMIPIASVVIVLNVYAMIVSCDAKTTSKAKHGDACIDLAERAIGECMNTHGNGPVDEPRVRFCTEQYVAIVKACRCDAPAEIPQPEHPNAPVPEYHDQRGAPPLPEAP